MTQHFHFWVHIQRKLNLNLEEISIPTCLLQHYPQQPRCRNDLNASGWMSDANMVRPGKRTLSSLQKGGNPVVCDNKDGSGAHLAKRNKLDTERQMLHIIYMQDLGQSNHRSEEENGGCHGWRVGEGEGEGSGQELQSFSPERQCWRSNVQHGYHS